MKFLVLDSKNPHLNLAIEEYLFSSCSDDIFMLWQNEPTVVIGKNQNVYSEIDLELLKENNVHLARRITGGGAVYHDLGNLNYTFISASEGEAKIDFERFTAPIIDVLRSLGLDVSLSGRNDLLIDEKKFSGNAQYSAGGRTLHHGTLLFDSDLDFLSNVLRVDPEKIKSKAISSARSRVTNLKSYISEDLSIKGFIELIRDHITRLYSPTVIPVPQNEEINKLYQRNSSYEWLFPEGGIASRYSILKKRRYPMGVVEIWLDLANDIIKDIRITGDFFGVDPISQLENTLKGTRISNVDSVLSNTDVSNYILGLSATEIAAQISE